jgi:hypothetical protein
MGVAGPRPYTNFARRRACQEMRPYTEAWSSPHLLPGAALDFCRKRRSPGGVMIIVPLIEYPPTAGILSGNFRSIRIRFVRGSPFWLPAVLCSCESLGLTMLAVAIRLRHRNLFAEFCLEKIIQVMRALLVVKKSLLIRFDLIHNRRAQLLVQT